MKYIITYNGIRPLTLTAEELYHELLDYGKHRAATPDGYAIMQQLIDHPNVIFRALDATSKATYDVFDDGSESYLECIDLGKQLDDHMRVNLTVVVEHISDMGEYFSLKTMVSKSNNIVHLYRQHTIDEILKDLT